MAAVEGSAASAALAAVEGSAASAALAAPVALVFGPEPSGLSNAEVTRCHHLIHIPADPSYSALNLAQSVAVCLYELRKCWLRQAPLQRPLPAPFVMQERVFEQLRTALEEIHFLYGERAEPLMHALRHLIGRAGRRSRRSRCCSAWPGRCAGSPGNKQSRRTPGRQLNRAKREGEADLEASHVRGRHPETWILAFCAILA